MVPEKKSFATLFDRFSDHWSPHLVGEVNQTAIKVAKIKGEFVWHHHEHEDELFFVVKGRLTLRFRDGEQILEPGEFLVVPRGVEHQPCAEDETHIVMVEPSTTLNTGDLRNDLTVVDLPRL